MTTTAVPVILLTLALAFSSSCRLPSLLAWLVGGTLSPTPLILRGTRAVRPLNVRTKIRHIGSTGQCQDPGRVFKGKKMPGRMGNDRVTVQNLKILKVGSVVWGCRLLHCCIRLMWVCHALPHRSPACMHNETVGVCSSQKIHARPCRLSAPTQIDPRRDLLFVRGHVPGQNGGFLRVTDAIK